MEICWKGYFQNLMLHTVCSQDIYRTYMVYIPIHFLYLVLKSFKLAFKTAEALIYCEKMWYEKYVASWMQLGLKAVIIGSAVL